MEKKKLIGNGHRFFFSKFVSNFKFFVFNFVFLVLGFSLVRIVRHFKKCIVIVEFGRRLINEEIKQINVEGVKPFFE